MIFFNLALFLHTWMLYIIVAFFSLQLVGKPRQGTSSYTTVSVMRLREKMTPAGPTTFWKKKVFRKLFFKHGLSSNLHLSKFVYVHPL